MFGIKTVLSFIILLFVFLAPVTSGKIIYVDGDVFAFVSTGSSWALAYNHLQDALADANSSEGPVEIHVAQGVYKPDEGIGIEAGDRDASFQLVKDVVLKGGYAGFGEPNADARDTVLYETILSGDLDGNDIIEVSDPCNLLYEPTRAENSYTVITAVDSNCILDGFTISGGNADEPFELNGNKSQRYMGGGMYTDMSSVTIINCIFRDNSARSNGGGILCDYGEGPTLDNCVFIRNSSGYIKKKGNSADVSGNGGGMYNYKNSPTLTNCRFIGNSSTYGAGMINYGSSLMLTNCIFSGNKAMKFNVLRGGRVLGDGGAIHYGSECRAIMTNCTFMQNSAGRGSTLICDAFNRDRPSVLKLINCILWDGSDEIVNHDNSIIEITYSDVQGGWLGRGGYNIDADPLFANPGCWVDVNDPNVIVEPNNPNAVWVDGDYHLKSGAGRWDSENDCWVIDEISSPCIDAGDPDSSVGDEPEPNGGIINMGAYGGTAQAGKSL